MTKKKWVLICDESGAKASSKKTAKDGDQIGVVAGLLLSNSDYEEMVKILPELRSKYETSSSKLHITDLDVKKQRELRNDIYSIINNFNGHIVYEAILQNFFHKGYKTEKRYWEKLKYQGKKQGYGYNYPVRNKRLQTVLFLCCFVRAFAYVHKGGNNCDFELNLLTDNIDTKIKNEIEKEIDAFLNPKLTVEEYVTAARFDDKTQKVQKVSGILKYRIDMPNGNEVSALPGVSFSLKIDNTCDIIADVLANSILYYINKSFNKNNKIRLSSIDAIVEHPLVEKFLLLTEDDDNGLRKLYQFYITEEEIDSDEMRTPTDIPKDIEFYKDQEE